MYIHKNVVRSHKVSFSILLFLFLFSMVHYTRPTLLYNSDGSFRTFGVGYRQKTVIPIWAVAIFMGILCYLAVLYYLML
jgi:hypothetical protein